MNKELKSRVRQKKDTEANWNKNNPLILDGETIVVVMPNGKKRTKIGDGNKRYNQLEFQDYYQGEKGDLLGFIGQNELGAVKPPALPLYTATYQGKLSISNWQSSTGLFFQQVTVEGMTQNQFPLVYPIWSESKQRENIAWNKIDKVETFDGYVKFYSKTKPESDVDFVLIYHK